MDCTEKQKLIDDMRACLENIVARNWVEDTTDAYDEAIELINRAKGVPA